jgi:hypothetical protein
MNERRQKREENRWGIKYPTTKLDGAMGGLAVMNEWEMDGPSSSKWGKLKLDGNVLKGNGENEMNGNDNKWGPFENGG